MPTLRQDAMIVGGGVVLIVLASMYLKGKVSAVAGAVADAVPYVNPADPRNFVNAGLGYVGSAASGNPDWSLGTAIYDMVHPVPEAGDQDWSLGTKIYDLFN